MLVSREHLSCNAVSLKHTGGSVAVVYLHRALQTGDTLFQCEAWNTSHECFFDKRFIERLEETPGQLTTGRDRLNVYIGRR